MYKEENIEVVTLASVVRDLMSAKYGSAESRTSVGKHLLSLAQELESRGGDRLEQRKLRAFDSFLRTGFEPSNTTLVERANNQEFRDLSEAGLGTGAATGAGVYVPVEFNRAVDEAMAYAGPLVDRDIVTIEDTPNGRNLARPSDDDTAVSAELVAEGQGTSLGDPGILNQKLLGAFKYSSKLVRVSNELLDDAGFDFSAYLARKFGIRMARGLNPVFTHGTGVGQPKGICTQLIAEGHTVNCVGVGNVPSLPTSDDFANLEAAIDPIYRPNAIFQVAPSTLQYLRTVKDSVGNPLFKQLHTDNTEQDFIFGYPVKVNPALDVLTNQHASPVSTYSIALFGSFKTFHVRRAPAVVFRIAQKWAEYNQTAFLMLQRYDCANLAGGAASVAVLQASY